VQPEHSVQYAYDGLKRLQSVAGTAVNWSVSWQFDEWGNRTQQSPSGLAAGRVGSQSIGYANNRVVNPAWVYDAAGNVTYDGTLHYYYDAESRLIQIDSPSIQYAYDGEGRRARKTVGGTTTYFFYGQLGLMSEFSTSSFLSSASGAAATDRLRYRIGEPTGTAVLVMDSAGTVRENNRILPYGEPWTPVPPSLSANDLKFTTYQHDDESGLDYAMARYYAGRSGRFMTPDPGLAGAELSDPQSWNAYAYTTNDPINKIDPAGMEEWAICFDGDCKAIGPGTDYPFEYVLYLARIGGMELTIPLGSQEVSSILCPRESEGVYACGVVTHSRDVPFSIADSTADGIGAGVLSGGVRTVATQGSKVVANELAAAFTSVLRRHTAPTVTNPIPRLLARVIPGTRPFVLLLGKQGAKDVFVTAADDIAGLNARQLAERLSIPYSETFTVIIFPAPAEGIASPVFRANVGFMQGGLTRGGAREWVIPNDWIPSTATVKIVK
jgi:RHS repeat-associated protein